MNATTQTVHRVDATATHNPDKHAPGYTVIVNGELVAMYLVTERTAAPSYLQSVPADSTHLVGFEATDDNGFWWGELGGAASRREAEHLLVTLADGRPGKGFIVPIPADEGAAR